MPTAQSELLVAMLCDARLPTGGHTQSAGLEPAVMQGVSAPDVAAYLDARLDTTVAVDSGTAVVARHLTLSGLALQEVVDAWAARTPSAALRHASRQMGRGYLRLARQLWPDAEMHEAMRTLDNPPRPVVLGAIAATTGLTAGQVVRVVAYDDVQTVTSASLKLLPLDPIEATGWALDCHPAISRLIERQQDLTEPDQIPASSAPLIEQWAQQHSRATMRLFNA